MSYGIDARKESFELVTVLGKKMIFTCLRVDRETVPKNLFIYEVRHDDDQQGIPIEIAKWIRVNHWGTLISKEEVDLIPHEFIRNAYRDLKEDDFNYEGVSMSLDEYLEGSYD